MKSKKEKVNFSNSTVNEKNKEEIWENNVKYEILEILEMPQETGKENTFYEWNDDFSSEIYSMLDSELNIFRNLSKWNNERIYLEKFWEPKNIVYFWNWEKIYVTNCLVKKDRKYMVWFARKWNQAKLRLFYKSKSEWAWRSCPWARDGRWYSKWEGIKNSSYETTTRLPHEVGLKFDMLSKENVILDPILDLADLCGMEILEAEMQDEIIIDKLFDGYKRNTSDSFYKKSSSEVVEMYRHLWSGFNLKEMKILEWKWYTYEHQYLWTVEVQICRLNFNWKNIDFHFARVKDDPLNRVRIEQLTYADAKLTSFLVYDKQINAAPLTWKPIEYVIWVPYDMYKNERIKGSDYIDIRDLYQENIIIKRFKTRIQ